MHELGIATQIAETVRKVMEEHNARRVGEITVEIGGLAGVDKDSLEFCFDAIIGGTPLEGAHLKIMEVRPEAHCKKCGREYVINIQDFSCPGCGARDFEVIGGTDICIKQVEVE